MMLRKCSLLLLILAFFVGLSSAQLRPITTSLTFTTIDVPGAGFSSVNSINSAGDLVGNYGTIDNGLDSHGYVYSQGNFTFIDYPGAETTNAHGINDTGLIVGSAGFSSNRIIHGFKYNGQTFKAVDAPGQPQTILWGVNNAGNIVGETGNFSAQTHAITVQNGRLQVLTLPVTATKQGALGITNFGVIAAYAVDALTDYGWLDKGGTFKSLAFPGASSTVVTGVNDKGTAVGYYFLSGQGFVSFAYLNGKYISFAVPGATSTFASGINNSGVIVGGYVASDFTEHGFVSSPISVTDLR
jgi:hypothetical protein